MSVLWTKSALDQLAAIADPTARAAVKRVVKEVDANRSRYAKPLKMGTVSIARHVECATGKCQVLVRLDCKPGHDDLHVVAVGIV